MNEATAGIRVTGVPTAHRFEARLGDKLVGVAEYERHGRTIRFVHTKVLSEFEGQGVGSALARTALDRAAAIGMNVEPVCPFIAGWIDRHPEYQRLRRASGGQGTTDTESAGGG